MIVFDETQLEKLKNWIVTLIKMAREYDGRVITKAENGALKISSYDSEFAQGIYDAIEKLTQAMYLMNERARPYLLFEKDLINIFNKSVDYSLGYYNTTENLKLLMVHSQQIIKCAKNLMPIAFKKSTESSPIFQKVNYDLEKAFINNARSIHRLYGETPDGYNRLITLVQESFGNLFKIMIISIQLKDFSNV